MVDTFTCDSCGRNNVPTTDKKKLIIKETIDTGKKTKYGKPQNATVTQGQEICPDCRNAGIVRNHLKVSKDGEPDRFFTWNPRKDMESTYQWGQNNNQESDKETDKKE